MTQTGTYTVDQFVGDVRNVFAATKDPRAQAEAISGHMERLLATDDLGEEIMRRGQGRPGRVDLYIDDEYGHPGPGFLLMSSIPGPAGAPRSEAPHDHGAGFVVYGVYKGSSMQVKYHWVYPQEGAWTRPVLREKERFLQKEGQAAYFLPGEIHLPERAGDEPARIVRLESQRLDRVLRHSYDLATNSAALQYAATPIAPLA